MLTEKIKISKIKGNPDNPRIIKDDRFKGLVQSIKEFPEMLELRPIVVDKDLMVLGGNMRLKACKELKLQDVYITKAENLTDEQKKEFIIKDNASFGEWDYSQLSEWDNEQLEEWGVNVWQNEEEIDYGILDEIDVSEQLEEMTQGVKKAIQIEFELSHYDTAAELVKFWRKEGAYLGGMIIEYLKAEKEKI